MPELTRFDQLFQPRRSQLFPFKQLRKYKVLKWAGASSNVSEQNWQKPTDVEETFSLDNADIVSSAFSYPSNQHMVVLDIDVPATLVPSSTPGHSHLYIDAPMDWDVYSALLDALGDAGILEPGYVGASKARGFTAVRLPWVSKEEVF